MTCPDCTHAATKRFWPGYQAACHGCKVRALANGPQFWCSLQERRRTPGYNAVLVSVFGEEGAEAGHASVLAEYRRRKMLRAGGP